MDVQILIHKGEGIGENHKTSQRKSGNTYATVLYLTLTRDKNEYQDMLYAWLSIEENHHPFIAQIRSADPRGLVYYTYYEIRASNDPRTPYLQS